MKLEISCWDGSNYPDKIVMWAFFFFFRVSGHACFLQREKENSIWTITISLEYQQFSQNTWEKSMQAWVLLIWKCITNLITPIVYMSAGRSSVHCPMVELLLLKLCCDHYTQKENSHQTACWTISAGQSKTLMNRVWQKYFFSE